MPAKKVKTLMRNPKMRKHRSHRSKKGARKGSRWSGKDSWISARDFKKQRVKLVEKEIEKELTQI